MENANTASIIYCQLPIIKVRTPPEDHPALTAADTNAAWANNRTYPRKIDPASALQLV